MRRKDATKAPLALLFAIIFVIAKDGEPTPSEDEGQPWDEGVTLNHRHVALLWRCDAAHITTCLAYSRTSLPNRIDMSRNVYHVSVTIRVGEQPSYEKADDAHMGEV